MPTWPFSRSRLMARLRSEAVTRRAFSVLTRDLSFWWVPSRTQWSLFSISRCRRAQAAGHGPGPQPGPGTRSGTSALTRANARREELVLQCDVVAKASESTD
jgi:hypothetical protein